MNRNRANKPKNVHNSKQTKIKSYRPQYKGTRVFTLKDLIDEADEQDEVSYKKDTVAVDNFLVDDIEDDDFAELRMLAIQDMKEKGEKQVQVKNNSTAIKKSKKKGKPKKKAVFSENNIVGPKGGYRKKQNELINDFITIDQFEEQHIAENDFEDQLKEKKKKEKAQPAKLKFKSSHVLESFEERTRRFEERKRKKQQRLEEEMKKVNCFKPSINAKSRKLDKKRFKCGNPGSRQDNLYELNYVLKERKEELRDIIEMERFEKYGEDELKNCTFKPKINEYKGNVDIEERTISERNQQWEKKKREKINKIKEMEKDSELDGCTFTPQINRYYE